MSELEKIVARNRLDLDIQIANDRVSRAARPSVNTKLEKRITPIDKQVIDEYNKQFKTINIPPQPPLPTEPEYARVYDENEIKNMLETKDEKVDELSNFERELISFQKDLNIFINQSRTMNKKHFDDIKDFYEYSIDKAKQNILALEADIKKIDALLARNDDVKKSNAVLHDRYAKDREYAAKMYQEEIKTLNRGTFQAEKGPFETDAQFYERLQKIAKENVDQDLADGYQMVSNDFREKLKEIFNSPSKIDQIANMLTKEEKKAFLIKFPSIQRYLAKTYDVNSNQFTAMDLVRIFHDKESEIGREEKETPIRDTPRMDTPRKEPLETESSFTSTPRRRNSEPPLPVAEALRLSPEQIDRFDTGEIEDYIREKYHDSKSLKGVLSKQDVKERLGVLNIGNSKYNTLVKKTVNLLKEGSTKHNQPYNTFGIGIHKEDIPEYVPFGKLLLNLPKLYYKSTFVLKHNTRHKQAVVGLKNTKVSDHFAKIILNLLEQRLPTAREINALSQSEKQLYDRVMYIANLNKLVGDNKHDKTVDELKHRLQLIEGEISAGNNSPILIKDLYIVLHALKDFNLISGREIMNYMKQFK